MRAIRLVVAGVFLAIGTASFTAASPKPSREAQALVQALEARYHRPATLKAIFLERYSENRRAVQVESGTVYFSRPGRMRWEYEAPEKQLFLVDGRNAWFYVPADRTVTRAPIKQSADWRTPLALLAGKAKLSRLCAQIELAEGRGLPAGHVLLRCTPRGEPVRPAERTPANALDPEESYFTEVFLEVDPQRAELARVTIHLPDGIEIECRFGNWRENLPLPESLFHFQPPLGVAIVEEPGARGPAP